MKTLGAVGILFFLVMLSGCVVRFVEPGVYQTYDTGATYYRQPIYSEYYNAPVVYYGSGGQRSHHNNHVLRPAPVAQPTTVYQTITVNEGSNTGISHTKAQEKVLARERAKRNKEKKNR